MDYDIESKLNTVSVKPMTQTEKNMMWRKIELGINKKDFHVFGFIRTRVRAMVAFVLVALFAGSGVAFAYADTAMPGDVLFPLGVAREKVQIFLASEAKKNDLRVKFAEKRIEDGQVFLSLLVKAKGTYASSTATTTVVTGNAATTTAAAATTTSNTATDDATRHFNATITYLRGIQTELLKNGDTLASSALQNTIDAMISQAHQVPLIDDNDSVLVKIKDNANKFKMDVRISDGTTTTRVAIGEKNKKDGHGKNSDEDNAIQIAATTTAQSSLSVRSFVRDNFIMRFFHRGDKERVEEKDEQKKEDRKERDDDEKENDDERGKIIPASDVTAPNISDLSATAVTASSATVSWNTNEPATGKVKYGTANPLANVLESTALSSGHAFNLTGLTASSTYHYAVSSADGVGNATSSAELIFTTN